MPYYKFLKEGWITTSIFYSWLKRELFIRATILIPKPIILLVDSHASHTSLLCTVSCPMLATSVQLLDQTFI